MRIISSIIIAFAMYSKVPMPRVEWKKENMRYVMCAFPLVGALLGGLTVGFRYLSDGIGLGHGIRTAVFVILPIVVTGGIHLDGFMDTSDALGSWQEKEKRLEKSIDENGYDPSKCAIVLDKNNIVVDGQHRSCILYYKYGGNYAVKVIREKSC